MAEWLKAHAWKACLLERVTWVRIPLSPPTSIESITYEEFYTEVNPLFHLIIPFRISAIQGSRGRLTSIKPNLSWKRISGSLESDLLGQNCNARTPRHQTLVLC